MIVYNQIGRLTFGGKAYGAYSGHGLGKNNHAYETMANVGPIPCGDWEIIRWDDHHGDKGPVVAVLRPVGHDAHNRTDFLMHGDSLEHPGEASHGCVIANRMIRDTLRASGETKLRVVSGLEAVA